MLILFKNFYSYGYVFFCRWMFMEIRGQFLRVGSPFLLHRAWGLNLGCQMWWVPVLLTEPSCWPGCLYLRNIHRQTRGRRDFCIQQGYREDKSKQITGKIISQVLLKVKLQSVLTRYKVPNWYKQFNLAIKAKNILSVTCFPLQRMFSITSSKILSRYSLFDYLELNPQCLNLMMVKKNVEEKQRL